MKRLLAALLLFASTASAELTIKDSKIWFNGVRQEMVWGSTCFKLASVLTYHWTGQGGGHYTLGTARQFVDHVQGLGIQACRVLLETSQWDPCEPPDLANDGKPDVCPWGSEPRDQGFWNVEALKTGQRPTDVHDVGKNVMRWFFETSQETGFMFELVIIATVKHADLVPVDTQTHMVRQVMSEARELQQEFPQALILMTAINEHNAHSRWTVAEVNMLAVRNDRCKHPDGRVAVALECPPGFEPEQWAGGPFIVDGGGKNRIEYKAGTTAGVFRCAIVHPERDETWHLWPDLQEREWMVRDANGGCWGANESMFYVEPEDEERGRTWYRTAGDRLNGWTTDWPRYEAFLNHINLSWQGRVNASTGVRTEGLAYFVLHNEKHAQASTTWPRAETRLEKWAREHLGGVPPEPPPPPPPKQVYFDPIIDGTYRLVLARPVDPGGLGHYNAWLRECVPARGLPACIDALEVALFESPEYREKWSR